MKKRVKCWAIAIGLSFLWIQCDKWRDAENVELEPITVNAPKAMHEAFEATFEELKLDKKYRIEFTESEDANFTVTTQESEGGEEIAYSPIIAVFNNDKELFQSYIDKEIFVPSDTEKAAYDFDFQKIMMDIIENPNSSYKVYYPDSNMGNESVFYSFLIYTANGGFYPKDDTNMKEIKQQVEKFLNSKNTEKITSKTLDKINGFSKNSIYFMSLADLGYIFENKGILCKVMYPKTVLYYNYYAYFDETGKIIYDALDDDIKKTHFSYGEDIGYYYLKEIGNYFVDQFQPEVSISYTENRETIKIVLREHFNVVETPKIINSNKEER